MFAEIALPFPSFDTLTYSIPENYISLIKVGSLVEVELKSKLTPGIVVALSEKSNINNTKNILRVLNSDFLSSELFALLNWVKKYYFIHWGSLLRLAIPQSVYRYHCNQNQNCLCEPNNIAIDKDFNLMNKIIDYLRLNQYRTFLLFNKDQKVLIDLYLYLINETIKLRKSVIILVPEIILSASYLKIFQSRFENNFFIYHSGLRPNLRNQMWYNLRNRDFSVVLGTRSACFVPVCNLGLIIVDHEHDTSYKEQERHFHYHARDVAIIRSQLNNAVTVLSSTTPSIESYYNAKINKYEMINISTRKHYPSQHKFLKLIDMRKHKSSMISPSLQYSLQKAHRAKQPIVLYINKLGFSSQIICQECGYIPVCPHCGLALILNREGKALSCNLCNYQTRAFDSCPKCKGNYFNYKGLGIQKVVSEVKKIIPHAKILRVDSDNIKKSTLFNLNLDSHHILITTKLGLHNIDYTKIVLFAFISADNNLYCLNFRASEKTFQELTQIINKCSQHKKCQLIIQTHHPDHFAIYSAIKQNYEKFYYQELKQRKKLNYPPYSRLALIKVFGHSVEFIQQTLNKLIQNLSALPSLTILGPTLTSKINKKQLYCSQLLIKLKPHQYLANLISRQELLSDQDLLKAISQKKLLIDIDVDPI